MPWYAPAFGQWPHWANAGSALEKSFRAMGWVETDGTIPTPGVPVDPAAARLVKAINGKLADTTGGITLTAADVGAYDQAAGDTRYTRKADLAATRRATAGLFRGLVPLSTRNLNLGSGNISNGTDTSGMYRFSHKVHTSLADTRLVYANFYGAQGAAIGDGPNPITVEASVEPPVNAYTAVMAATVYPVTFDGALTVTIPPGAVVVSDPIPVTADAGQIIYSNTYVSVAAAGQRWPLGQNTIPAGVTVLQPVYYEGGATGAPATKTTAGGSTPPTGYVSGYGPVAVVGNPAAGEGIPASVYAFGDSILFGSHDFTPVFDGWLGRACVAEGIGYLNVAHPGEQASHVQGTGMRQRLPLAASCDVAVVAYGRNDLANIAGVTLATFQGYVINVWKALASRGLRVYHATLTPMSSSTDGWITTSGQTVNDTNAYNTNRKAFNAWLRDGAPLNSSTLQPVAVGTSGALRASAAGHPLTGYIEVADVVETARDSGIWKQGRVVTDAAITSGSRNITSATANFTQADVGHAISITGAGAAGATLQARIASVTNATTAVYEGASAASATATGQTLGIGFYTTDGTHPTTSGHMAVANAVNVAAL